MIHGSQTLSLPLVNQTCPSANPVCTQIVRLQSKCRLCWAILYFVYLSSSDPLHANVPQFYQFATKSHLDYHYPSHTPIIDPQILQNTSGFCLGDQAAMQQVVEVADSASGNYSPITSLAQQEQNLVPNSHKASGPNASPFQYETTTDCTVLWRKQSVHGADSIIDRTIPLRLKLPIIQLLKRSLTILSR